MDVSIIIVNYNVKKYIVSCIESIYKHSSLKVNFEIIVVDNNSQDGSAEFIKTKYPKIQLIENDSNLGFSIACNQGFRISKGEFVFFLNPDTEFIEDSLLLLLKEAKEIRNGGIIGPSLISVNKKINRSYWKNPSLTNTILSIVHLDFFNFRKNYYFKKKNKTFTVDTLSGGAMFIKSNIFKKLKGFDENFFWMEDIDICKRAVEKGYTNFHTLCTSIIHLSGKSSIKNYKVAISNQLISKVKFFKKHHGETSSKVILFVIIMISIIKVIIYLILFPFSNTFREKLKAYLHTLKFISFDSKTI